MRFALCLLSASLLALSACGNAQPPSKETASTETPFTDLQKAYPVTLSKIADTVWVHTSTYTIPGQSPIPVNGLVIVDGDEVILADAAWGELATLSLLKTVEKEVGKPVTKLITTHHHADRVMGVDAAEWKGVEVFTHPDTPALAAQNGWPVPNTSVAALKQPGSRIKVGNVEVAYPGPGHAPDNLVVYVPSANILYGGCAVRGAESTSLGNIADADLKKWAKSLNWVKATYPDAKLVVPGHGKGADLRLIDHTLELLAKKVNSQTADSNGDTPEDP